MQDIALFLPPYREDIFDDDNDIQSSLFSRERERNSSLKSSDDFQELCHRDSCDCKDQAKSAAGWSGDLEIPDAGSTSEPDAADIWEELFPGLPRFDGSELTEEYCIRDDILYQFLATKLRSASDDSLEGSDAISESSQRNIESVSKTSRKAKRSTILESLALEDYEIYQREYSRIRGPGTYQWLLGTDAFKTWLSEPSQTFSCYGIPGSGKSSLASAVIDHVVDHVADDATTGIAYVYCNQDRTALGAGDDAYYLFLNILKQLAEQLALIIPELQFLYNTQDLSGVPESISEVCRTIEYVAEGYSKIYIIVDAIDEIQEGSRGRMEFLSEMVKLRKHVVSTSF
ncbi:hypothetical protein CGMCC3_g13709 [Colletotrichum fructicola]|uniref:Ankyrin repeat protein n=1 Tax=Colletotrichum fructicola (strain Nara gc5) TaxID=1213859 RepID=L2FDA1_COLFN|nr:uncharacterized protein CGMCC3_g13709 [Colletotrichum fructicola]KAE9570153.1 hypothetical protein CGMCC3_g13709 [Colletotrichum fructicola]